MDASHVLGGEQLSLARAAVKGGAVVVPRVFSQPFHQPAAGDAELLGRGFEGEADAVSHGLNLLSTAKDFKL